MNVPFQSDIPTVHAGRGKIRRGPRRPSRPPPLRRQSETLPGDTMRRHPALPGHPTRFFPRPAGRNSAMSARRAARSTHRNRKSRASPTRAGRKVLAILTRKSGLLHRTSAKKPSRPNRTIPQVRSAARFSMAVGTLLTVSPVSGGGAPAHCQKFPIVLTNDH